MLSKWFMNVNKGICETVEKEATVCQVSGSDGETHIVNNLTDKTQMSNHIDTM